MKDLVSVIVPVYNVEKYLKRCINSILNQTYQNLEIILVNDGSSDNSRSICDEYGRIEERVTVIHQCNQGVSRARNAGIDCATGKYLVFIDSDDFVHQRYVELLHRSCTEHHAQIAVCAFRTTVKEEYKLEEWTKGQVMTGKEFVRNTYNKKIRGIVSPWNKMYLSTCFKQYRFPEERIHEDTALIYKILYYVDTVVYLPNELYYYYLSSNSIMRSKFTEKRLDWIKALDEKLNFLIANNERELYERTLQEYEAVILKLYFLSEGSTNNKKEIQTMLYEKYLFYLPKVLDSKEISIAVKALFIAGKRFPYVVGKIINGFV